MKGSKISCLINAPFASSFLARENVLQFSSKGGIKLWSNATLLTRSRCLVSLSKGKLDQNEVSILRGYSAGVCILHKKKVVEWKSQVLFSSSGEARKKNDVCPAVSRRYFLWYAFVTTFSRKGSKEGTREIQRSRNHVWSWVSRTFSPPSIDRIYLRSTLAAKVSFVDKNVFIGWLKISPCC